MTEQGEVLADRYGDPQIAYRHLEQVVWATLTAAGQPAAAPTDSWMEVMEQLAGRSLEHYRELIGQPGLSNTLPGQRRLKRSKPWQLAQRRRLLTPLSHLAFTGRLLWLNRPEKTGCTTSCALQSRAWHRACAPPDELAKRSQPANHAILEETRAGRSSGNAPESRRAGEPPESRRRRCSSSPIPHIYSDILTVITLAHFMRLRS